MYIEGRAHAVRPPLCSYRLKVCEPLAKQAAHKLLVGFVQSMELTGVEPVSALGSNTSLIHRFSLSDPQGGNRHLSPTVGFSSKVLANLMTRGIKPEHPLGLNP